MIPLDAVPVTSWVAGTSTPGPTQPALREGLQATDVSPGVLGFIAIFVAALACIPLFRSMTSKIRGVSQSPDPAADEDDPGTGPR